MPLKEMPFTKNDLEKIAAKFPTPFHIYDEKAIRENARDLLRAFEWNEGFKEYFAVKATPNPFILKILKSEGLGTDCSALPELLRSEIAGIVGTDIMFSSNDPPAIEFQKARQLNAIINLDDISHISFLEKNGGIPTIISVRYNPGKLREGSFIMGSPENAKYGFTREQVFTGLSELRQRGSRRFGLHTFIASNELNPDYFVDTADMLFDLSLEIKEKLRIRLEFVNISGGIGIPYQPDEKKVNLAYVGEGIRKKYQEKIRNNGLHPLSFFLWNA